MEIEILELRAQVIAQAQGIVVSNGGEQTAYKVVEAAEVLWTWISRFKEQKVPDDDDIPF